MLPRLNKRWELRQPIPTEVDQALGRYPGFFRQILYGRGITDELTARAYLDCTFEDGITNPFHMMDMEDTVTRLLWAVDHHERIAVYGDYDVDGVTATALLVQVLLAYGADAVAYIPNRFEEGYGLNMDALDHLHEQGVRLVVTVDCGIRSPREAERAEALGMDLIITDHHQPGEEIPQAFTVLCPKRPGDGYPDKNLAGVGLAYKIAQALAARRPEAGVCADDWLDLVAVGTVADVAPLTGENRVLVRRGLQRLRLGTRLGLASLSNVAGVKLHRVSAGDIGFMLGPRLNAAGRLETAQASLELLMAADRMNAGLLAQQLDNQNRQRQELTRRMQEDAIRLSKAVGSEEILFAFDPDFNPGIVGLAAARLVDAYYRPAIVGERGPEFTRASCRSIAEFHITHALDECGDLLVRHGGHALAAGFTVRNENLPALIERMSAIAKRELAGKDLRPVLRADLELPLVDLRPEILEWLDKLQPTGQENAEAVFVSRNLRVVRYKPVGADSQHLRLTVTDGRIYYNGIAFRQGHRAASMPERVDVMYVFERNEFNGEVTLQLNIRDFRPAGMAD